MAATIETLGNLERKLTITIPMASLQQEIDTRIANLTKTARVAGFRPGKVPLKIVQQQYGSQVRDDVLSGAVERSFGEAVQEHKLRVAGYPDIQHKPFAEAVNDFEYTATFEVMPEIKLADLSQVSIDKPDMQVSAADVDKTIEILRKQRATYESVKRMAKKGDRVRIALSASMEGNEIEKSPENGFTLLLGEGGRYAEFDENLIGGKAGGEKTFDITYPEDYQVEQLKDKKVSYQVNFLDVEQAVLPEVDAAFAKTLGVEDGDVEKMKTQIKESLEQEVGKRIRARLKEQVFTVLTNAVDVELPKAVIGSEINRLAQTTINNMQQRGLDPSQYPIQPEMFEQQAKRNATLRLVLGDVINENKLHANAEQIKKMVDQFSVSFEDPEEVVQWYYEDPSRLEEPAALATEENVVDWVMSKAKVNNKVMAFDELMGNA